MVPLDDEMKKSVVLLLLAVNAILAFPSAAVSAEPVLVPAPQHMKVGNGVYAVKATCTA